MSVSASDYKSVTQYQIEHDQV